MIDASGSRDIALEQAIGWESTRSSPSVLSGHSLALCAFEQVGFNLSVRIGRQVSP